MSTCQQCGHVLEADDHFCAGCGRPADSMEHTGSMTSIIMKPADPSGPITAVGASAAAGIPRGSAMLVVRRGPGEGTQFALDAARTTLSIGRSPEADVFLDDITVSRRHAELRHGAEGWSVRDAGSLNGTYVNRKRVDDVRLNGGDEVQIGKFRFAFLVSDAG
jgi:pSer/pThr/pTyr-binding forkhead associated (FHA) protein